MHGKRFSIFFILILAVAFFSCDKNKTNGGLPRQKVQFDLGWKFHQGEAEGASESIFDDTGWQTLDIPHDWSIHDTFSKDNPTGRPGGFASGGIGWYRKNIELSGKDKEFLISIEFGGVYENSEVWINGNYLGKRPFGYISFSYDLTPFLNLDGDNIIAVRVDNSKQPNARWYTGSGMYGLLKHRKHILPVMVFM